MAPFPSKASITSSYLHSRILDAMKHYHLSLEDSAGTKGLCHTNEAAASGMVALKMRVSNF